MDHIAGVFPAMTKIDESAARKTGIDTELLKIMPMTLEKTMAFLTEVSQMVELADNTGLFETMFSLFTVDQINDIKATNDSISDIEKPFKEQPQQPPSKK